MAPPIKHLSPGARFGRWTVLAHAGTRSGHAHSACECDCGARQVIRNSHLRAENAHACRSCARTRHGLSATSEWLAWSNMRRRCSDPSHRSYAYYGKKGIQVCERWSSFESFVADMGPKPSARHSLERVDSDGNYEPGNCVWATPTQQARNTSQNVCIAFEGREACLAEWAERTGICRGTLESRLSRGWPLRRALTEEVHIEKRNRRCL